MVPLAPAKAATGPTITLSTTTGTISSAGITVGVEIDGSGFPQLKAGTSVSFCLRDATLALPLSCDHPLLVYSQAVWVNGHSGQVDTDANGNFQAFWDAGASEGLNLPGGNYYIFAQYTPNNGAQTFTSTVTFHSVPYLSVELARDTATGNGGPSGQDYDPTTRSAHFGSTVEVFAYGFGASDSVTVIGLPHTPSSDLTIAASALGKVTATYLLVNKEQTGGAVTITAFGSPSGLTATRHFTWKPSIQVFSDAACTTNTVSIPSATPRSFGIKIHGFQNGETIAANSITVGGTAASNSGVTVNTDGSSGCVAIISTGALSFGPTSIVVTGSSTGAVTFSGANMNIVTSQYGGSETMELVNQPLLVSAGQTSGTAIVSFSSNNVFSSGNGFTGTDYMDGKVWVYATGFQGAATISTTTWDGTGATITWLSTTIDGNGAALGLLTVPDAPKGSHTVVVTPSAGATNPGASVSVMPKLWFATYNSGDTAVCMCVSYTGNGNAGTFTQGSTDGFGYLKVYGSGFKASEQTALSVGSTQISAAGAGLLASASGDISFVTLIANGASSNGIPDIPGGTYEVTAAGVSTGNTATGVDYWLSKNRGADYTGVTVLANFQQPTAGLIGDLNPLAGSAVSVGQTIAVTSSISSVTGIHGLAPSSSYEIHLDGPSGPLLTTFTSNANGQVPPGVQFNIPTTTSGLHVIDFVQSGSSAVFGNTFEGPNWCDCEMDEFTFGSIYVNVLGALTLAPTAGPPGTMVGISGSGLATGQQYAVQVNGLSYTTFTTSSTGGVPSATSFAFPSINDGPAAAALTELGAATFVKAINTATGATDATGTFLLQGQLVLASASGAAGSAVAFTASGLQASQFYNIIWNAQINANGLTSGQAIASFQTTANGAASGTINVPAGAQPGAYVVQLLHSNEVAGAAGIVFRLVNPPSFTIGAPSGVGTTTLTPGTPAQTTLAGQPAASITYTNTLSSPITVVGYGVVRNSLGQIVYYTTATLSLSAGGTQTAYLILAGLPSGSYQVSIFAISTNGVVVSTTSTITVSV